MNTQDSGATQIDEHQTQATAASTVVTSPLIKGATGIADLSLAQAQEIMDEAVRRYNTLDIDTMLSCFAPDVVVNYGNRAQFRGHEALREYLISRYASLTDFYLTKTVRCVTGNVMGIDATIKYTSKTDGKKYQGRVFEFVEIENGLVSLWDNVSLYWERHD